MSPKSKELNLHNEVEVTPDLGFEEVTRPRQARGRPPGSKNRRTIADYSTATTGDDLMLAEGDETGLKPRRPRFANSRLSQEKPFMPLSMAADILGLHPRTLRIYEKEMLVIPHRTKTQRRFYSMRDLERVQFVQFLTQTRRVNLEGVKIILSLLDELYRLGIPNPKDHIFPDYPQE